MRSSGRGVKRQSFAAMAWEAAQRFFFKTVIPLAPICLIVYWLLSSHTQNISGEYYGASPVTGMVRLVVNENNGLLTGGIILRDSVKLKITASSLEGSKLSLVFKLPVALKSPDGDVIDRFTFRGEHHSEPWAGVTAHGIVKSGDFIQGVFNNGTSNIALTLRRNTTGSLLRGGRDGLRKIGI